MSLGSAPPAMAQPPVGSSPASSPVPNKGLEVAGLAQLALVIKQLEKLVPMLGASSEPGKEVLKALTSLSKHVQPGTVPPGAEQNQLQQLMLKLRQNAPQLAALRSAMSKPPGAGGPMGAGGPPGAPPGGAPPSAEPAEPEPQAA